MKRLIVVLGVVATNAMALDFDKEWAKFDTDFAKFKSHKVVKVDTVAPIVEAIPAGEVVQVDPKSPERLGLKLSDPVMREKVTSLYKKPDTVVFATTIQ